VLFFSVVLYEGSTAQRHNGSNLNHQAFMFFRPCAFAPLRYHLLPYGFLS